jgi:hypothetical protein
LPRAALGKGFAESLRGFAESLGPSAKQPAPVVYIARKIIKRLVRATQVVPYYDLVCAKYSSYVL